MLKNTSKITDLHKGTYVSSFSQTSSCCWGSGTRFLAHAYCSSTCIPEWFSTYPAKVPALPCTQ